MSMIMTMTIGGNKNVTNSEKDAKIVGKKDISSILVWNPLTMSMSMTMTIGGSKNVTNSEKDAKIVGKKGYILNFSMESTDYEHDHDHDHGG